VNFTVREFETFFALAERCGPWSCRRRALPPWCGAAICRTANRSVDVFVRKVRRKLAGRSPGWTYIHTHFGIGYRFSA